MTNAIKALLQMTSVSLQPVPSLSIEKQYLHSPNKLLQMMLSTMNHCFSSIQYYNRYYNNR
jgi:hypothetical protein